MYGEIVVFIDGKKYKATTTTKYMKARRQERIVFFLKDIATAKSGATTGAGLPHTHTKPYKHKPLNSTLNLAT